MNPFVYLFVVFWLYTTLQCLSSMSTNSLVFHTSGDISSSPAAFLFLIFLSTNSNYPCVNCPSLMSNRLLIIFMIGSCVTFGSFPSKFTKSCFHWCIRSSWLVSFSLAFTVLFLLLSSFTVFHAILDCLSSTESLILMIWFGMYSVCSFRYMSANSFWAFLSFRALILVEFLLLHLVTVFTSTHFFPIANISQGTLGLALCLVDMHPATTSKWALRKFPYSSFGVGVSDISWCASNLFLSVNVYLFLISLLLSR